LFRINKALATVLLGVFVAAVFYVLRKLFRYLRPELTKPVKEGAGETAKAFICSD
jgi:hypothetical protein